MQSDYNRKRWRNVKTLTRRDNENILREIVTNYLEFVRRATPSDVVNSWSPLGAQKILRTFRFDRFVLCEIFSFFVLSVSLFLSSSLSHSLTIYSSTSSLHSNVRQKRERKTFEKEMCIRWMHWWAGTKLHHKIWFASLNRKENAFAWLQRFQSNHSPSSPLRMHRIVDINCNCRTSWIFFFCCVLHQTFRWLLNAIIIIVMNTMNDSLI